MAPSAIQRFLKLESAGGIILVAASVLAIAMANTPLGSLYFWFLDIPIAIKVGALVIDKPLLLWENDGLMAVFFFLVGLEIKREFLEGQLSQRDQIVLPALGAVGGMAIPAAIYVAVNWGHPENLNGWAIPAATDIAFALGVLAILGNRVPSSVKVLLLAIAIFDDIGAIAIIAVFYTEDLSLTPLLFAAVGVAGLLVVNLAGVKRIAPYVVIGSAMWVCLLKSGVHATLAGVVTAFAIPLTPANEGEPSPLKHLEHELHPWVAFGILPMFAFANAGVSFEGIGVQSFTEPVKLGISLGLFLGKQFGIFLCFWAAIALGIARKPDGVSWSQLYGISLLCGIGFTMSLFIGTLAFEFADFDAPIRLGVLTGSIASALCGYVLLRVGSASSDAEATPDRPEGDPERNLRGLRPSLS